MRQFFKVFLIFYGLCGLFDTTQAAKRPGVMRPVALVAPGQTATGGIFSNGTWHLDAQSKILSLIFTREAEGTRNLWQATPDADGNWHMKPLTNMPALQWVDHAQSLPDGRTIICVTNASGDGQTPHITRFDLKTGRMEAVLREDLPGHSPTVSPDGRSLAFVRDSGGAPVIYFLSLQDKSAPAIARRVTQGRYPAWLDNKTLLFSDARKSGLYRIEIPTHWSPLQPLKTVPQGVSWRGGAVNVAPDGSQLCLVGDDANGTAGQLFFMAPNGSGERALRNTQGARAPRFAPDGSALLFDAPLPNTGLRTLWIMQLTPIVPTIELAHVTAQTASSYQVVGTVFCEDSPDVAVQVEVGEGEAPQQWQLIASPKAPLQKETLAMWQLPQGAHGDWTLRLTARSPDGDAAQATMKVTLPLAAGAIVTNASPDVAIFVSPVNGAAGLIGTHGIPSRVVSGTPNVFPDKNHTTVPDPTHPDLLPPSKKFGASTLPGRTIARPSPNVPNLTSASSGASGGASGGAPSGASSGALQVLPLPALPPPPSSQSRNSAPPVTTTNPAHPTNSFAPTNATPPIVPTTPVVTSLPTSPVPQVPINLQAPPARHQNPNAKKAVPNIVPPKATIKTVTKPTSRLATRSTLKGNVQARRADAGQFHFDVPGYVKSGTEVVFDGRVQNKSKSDWNTSGASPVRVLVRWFDNATGQRARWEIKRLPVSLAPGESAPLSFSVTAPRPGKFRLQVALVRLPNGKYQPASTTLNEALDTLAQTTYRITVE
ncbi:MAG TPA: hypothetical protein VGB77_00685 [Abditibacteriaceae bacterium]